MSLDHVTVPESDFLATIRRWDLNDRDLRLTGIGIQIIIFNFVFEICVSNKLGQAGLNCAHLSTDI